MDTLDPAVPRSSDVVLITGRFNVLHSGHIRLFRFARELGARLVVGLLNDNLDPSIEVPVNLRMEFLSHVSLIDELVIVETSVPDLIRSLKPTFIVKGSEQRGCSDINNHLENEAADSVGAKVIFASNEFNYPVWSSEATDERNYVKDFLRRHSITQGGLLSLVDKFRTLRVCVFGDVILDEYISCQPLGMSQEDPLVVFTNLDSSLFLGGAGIVARHLNNLALTSKLYSVTGDDKLGRYVKSVLNEESVDSVIAVDVTRPTTIKKRFQSRDTTLFRLSKLHYGDIDQEFQDLLFSNFVTDANTHGFDLVLFSDFNYGCLPQTLVNKVLSFSRSQGIMTGADSQSSSQGGDILRFKGVDVITPTEREARLGIKDFQSSLVSTYLKLQEAVCVENILLTLGSEGLLGIFPDKKGEKFTDRLPALNARPKNVSGAGDSLFVTSSLTLAVGGSPWEAALLGSIAASWQVGERINAPLDTATLRQLIINVCE